MTMKGFQIILAFFLCSAVLLGEAELLELSPADVKRASEAGVEAVEAFVQLERKLLEKDLTARHGSAAYKHGQMVTNPSSANKRKQNLLKALHNIATFKHLQQKFNISSKDSQCFMNKWKSTYANKVGCPQQRVQCIELAKFRSIDGTCNNLENPHWGEQSTLFSRLLTPAYSNGIDLPRRGTDGELPSPRNVSNSIIKDVIKDQKDITLALMSWGQFITHDITQALGFTYEDGQIPACCASDGTHLPSSELHPFCLPIDIPANDPFYSRFNQYCMNFVRSLVGDDTTCTLNHAEQVNGITHFLDASMVYGSDDLSANNIRLFRNGLLKTSVSSNGLELLPVDPDCPNNSCFFAGDSRATENPQLAILHTMFVREHNRVAKALKKLNDAWTEEKLYQESRRVVVAEVQHITYTEFLPALLGSQAMIDYGLKPAPVGSFGSYSPSVNPGVTNEFAAAGFRIGHSLVQGFLQLYTIDDLEDKDKSFTLSDYFFDASRLTQEGFIDSALRGLTKQPSQEIDSYYTAELTRRLMKASDKQYGMDIVSLNIQRGRDHGIPDYNTIRSYCQLPKAQTFDDLRLWMDDRYVDSVIGVYDNVNDIDMYIAGLAEVPSRKDTDSLIGPTSLCLIADQFARTKNGDRFFYDVGGQPSSFTLEQLDQIRNTSLARIFCDNNDGTIDLIQPRAFHFPQGANVKVPCSSIPSTDLSVWQK